MSGGYELELADAEFGASTSSAAVAVGVHDEIGGPGAGLGVNQLTGLSTALKATDCAALVQLQLRDLLPEVGDQSEAKADLRSAMRCPGDTRCVACC